MTPTKMDNGKYPAFAWPGGYPLFYLTAQDDTLCPKCADKEGVVACDVNWEDPMLWCDVCSTRIESAYAEDGHPDRA